METQEVVTLTKADRCDRCGAQAKAMFTIENDGKFAELFFCGHHDAKHGEALTLKGFVQVPVEVPNDD